MEMSSWKVLLLLAAQICQAVVSIRRGEEKVAGLAQYHAQAKRCASSLLCSFSRFLALACDLGPRIPPPHETRGPSLKCLLGCLNKLGKLPLVLRLDCCQGQGCGCLHVNNRSQPGFALHHHITLMSPSMHR